MSDDPFILLGLPRTTTADAVRAARRRLAKEHHPDAGGDAATMRAINDAAAAALRDVAATHDARDVFPSPDAPSAESATPTADDWSGSSTDIPSFTVEALPAETFEALLIVAGAIGEVLDDDPPYRLDTFLREPGECWCRLDVVPDAGASTVSISIGTLDDLPIPHVEAVRDVWVRELNSLDW